MEIDYTGTEIGDLHMASGGAPITKPLGENRYNNEINLNAVTDQEWTGSGSARRSAHEEDLPANSLKRYTKQISKEYYYVKLTKGNDTIELVINDYLQSSLK